VLSLLPKMEQDAMSILPTPRSIRFNLFECNIFMIIGWWLIISY
jgi:hypothetical protein